MNKIILDTNAYTNFFKDYPELEELVQRVPKIYISPIVLGELYDRFKRGSREKINLKKLELFLDESNVELLNITKNTAQVYADVMQTLIKKGKPIPINDVWIAAQAMESGAVLVTYDKHFAEVPGLRIWGE